MVGFPLSQVETGTDKLNKSEEHLTADAISKKNRSLTSRLNRNSKPGGLAERIREKKSSDIPEDTRNELNY